MVPPLMSTYLGTGVSASHGDLHTDFLAPNDFHVRMVWDGPVFHSFPTPWSLRGQSNTVDYIGSS